MYIEITKILASITEGIDMPNHMIEARRCTLNSIVILLSLASPLYATDFTILSGTTETTQQSLGSSETGTIQVNGHLIISTGYNAVSISGIDAIVINDGEISTTNSIDALEPAGANFKLYNNGTISTVEDGTHSINASRTFLSVYNTGTISTAGNYSHAIFSGDDNTFVENSSSGTISTLGSGAQGIYAVGDDLIVENNGTISTVGWGAEGIASVGANAVINNSGTISTTGDYAHGILVEGVDTTINTRGLISVTGTGARAIQGNGTDTTLNLLAGSVIVGDIDLGAAGTDNDTVNIYGGRTSADFVLINVETINLFSGLGFVDDNRVVTVDPTGESLRSELLSGVTSSIHDVVSQRMAHTIPLKPIQVAALYLSPGMLFQERAPIAWMQVFGGSINHDSQGEVMAYDADHIGFTLGYEWDRNQIRLGVLGGVAHSKAKTEQASFKTESDSYYLGVYGDFGLGMLNLTASMLGGYAHHDNNRLVVNSVVGQEVAKSDMDSYFLSPSLTLSSAYTLTERLELRPSVSINYSMEWLDSYKEKGTTSSDFKVGARTLKVLAAKLQLAVAYQFYQNSELEFRVGVHSRHSDDDDTDVRIAGNSFSYSNAGDEKVSGRFAGVNLRVATQDNLSLIVDIEFGGNSDENYVNGQLGLDYRF